jgi:DNA-binding MarR family transcriptional regulator
MTLRDELQQTKPFTSLQEEALLNVVRTAATMTNDMEELLKERGITNTQYNVLRILRGAEPEGLCRNELRDRMLTRMPDVTRLLDRMEEAGLVARSRDSEDRRLVSTRITPAGRRMVDELDAPVQSYHRTRLAHVSDEQLQTLIELLTLARDRG